MKEINKRILDRPDPEYPNRSNPALADREDRTAQVNEMAGRVRDMTGKSFGNIAPRTCC